MNIMQLTQTIQLLPVPTSKATKAVVQPTLPGMEAEPTVIKLVVTNRQIAEVLANIAEMLELQNSNAYRIQAYRNASRGVLALEEQAADLLARGVALPVPGLGKRLRERITELVETGTMTFYNDLFLQSLPRGVRALTAVHFVGIRTAIRLYQELDIDTPEKLWYAALQHRIRTLPGFGPRSEARLQEAARRFVGQHAATPLGGVA